MFSTQRSCRSVIQTWQHARQFSSTPVSLARRKPKQKAPKSHPALPVPSGNVPKVVVPNTHALWGFFRQSRETMSPPREEAKHGRAWTAEELRRKSFEDLHSLWIICLKERNILATQTHERRRQRISMEDGTKQSEKRDRTVRRTMAGIKFVLNERFLAHQQAVELAAKDESIDFTKPEPEPRKEPPKKPQHSHKKAKSIADKRMQLEAKLQKTTKEDAVQIDAANALRVKENLVAA